VPEDKRVSAVSPVVALKARKNDVEAKGMKAAHVRDAVALVDFLAFIEKEVGECLAYMLI
jgi:Xaa-Pro aminopeptidase